MFCKKCGKLISDNAKFCSYCGQKKNSVEQNLLKKEEPKNKKLSILVKFIIGLSVIVVMVVVYVLILMPSVQENKLKDCLKEREIYYQQYENCHITKDNNTNTWSYNDSKCVNKPKSTSKEYLDYCYKTYK